MTFKNTNLNRTNNLNLLRLLAASLVVFSHSFPLSMGSNEFEPFRLLNGYFTFGQLAVAIFFVISGYLITISWNRKPHFFTFCWKRLLRIYPGVIAVILFTVFIIGPIATSLNLKEYLISIPYFQMIKDMILLSQVNLPGVFIDNTYPKAVNGSLWTLMWEAKMYLMTAIFGLSKIIKVKWPVIYLTLLAISITYLKLTLPIIGFFINDYSVYYLMGTLFAIYDESIKYNLLLLTLSFFIWIMAFMTPFFTLVSILFIPYAVLYLALKSKVILQNLLETGDFSYGIYIYAFPIQQFVVHLLQNEVSPIILFILSFPVIFIFSYFSWNLIEKKSLKLKSLNINKFLIKMYGMCKN